MWLQDMRRGSEQIKIKVNNNECVLNSFILPRGQNVNLQMLKMNKLNHQIRQHQEDDPKNVK